MSVISDVDCVDVSCLNQYQSEGGSLILYISISKAVPSSSQ